MKRHFWKALILPTLVAQLAMGWAVAEAVALPAACPRVGFTVVESSPTEHTQTVADGPRSIHIRRQWITTTGDIADIQLKSDHGDALLLIKFTPVAAQRLLAATTDRSGVRLAFLFNDTPLVSVTWEGPYGMPVDGSQISIKGGTGRARVMMKALRGCTPGLVRDDSH